MKKSLPRCPYCDTDLTYLTAFHIKANKSYYCENCHRRSYIKLDKLLQNIAPVLAIAVVITVLVFSIFIKAYLLGATIVLAWFLMFYAIVPFAVKLVPKGKDVGEVGNDIEGNRVLK